MDKHYRFEFEPNEASAYDWTFDRRVQSTWAMTADLIERFIGVRPSAVLSGAFGLATTIVRFENGLDYHGFLGDNFLTLDNFD
ncbi:hypothetical protein [Eikenella sp. HMSC061C02]|uniref:hypothetical protein n=1 Tax=Eikenella sp. HMSC061C02 TaxID=1715021 RepID=UPI0008A2C84D|nr:hypothetical protein [Eikenella sp. HMSC061C02]OFN60435.1 hypothetical protein HMPREF2541_08030 [Eikenella sp. HMSC061C02]